MKHLCPACGKSNSVLLEYINIEKQHAHYLSDDKDTAETLTHVLSETTTYYETLKCLICNLEYANPLLAPCGLWYSILYSKLNLFPSYRWEFGFVKNHIKKDDFVIDYGCGSGKFLLSITDKSSYIRGYDFSSQAISEARSRGVDAELLDDNIGYKITKPENGVDHIVAFHVLEHLDNPLLLFKFAQELSSDKTMLRLAVPSDKRATRLYGSIDYLDQPPHHLTRWNAASLKKIGLCAEWKLVDFHYEPISMRARLWEISRRTDIYKKLALRNKATERLLRWLLAVPIYFFKQEQLNELSGFSMLACYKRVTHQ